MTTLYTSVIKKLAGKINADTSIILYQLNNKISICRPIYEKLLKLFLVYPKDIISVILDQTIQLLLEEMVIIINKKISKIHNTFIIELPNTQTHSRSFRFVYYKSENAFKYLQYGYKTFYLNKFNSFNKAIDAPTDDTTVYCEIIVDECKFVIQCRTDLMPNLSLFDLDRNNYVDLSISEGKN